MNVEDRIKAQKISMGFKQNSKPCKECCFMKKDENKDALTNGDLCVRYPEFPFRVSPGSTCKEWCF